MGRKATGAGRDRSTARAEKAARRALELSPGQPEVMNLLADVLDEQKKKDEAAALRAKLAEGDPKLRASLAYNRGAELANQQKDPEAAAAFEEALSADPLMADAHYALGLCAYRTSDYTKSKVHLEKYLERAETLGGKRLMGPMPVGLMGTFAMFTDPDGLVIGLFREI